MPAALALTRLAERSSSSSSGARMAPPGGARGEREGRERRGEDRTGRKGEGGGEQDGKLVIATAVGVQAVQAK